MYNESLELIQLPFSIIYKIASYLRDTKSYGNFRISCRSIYESLPHIYSFYPSGSLCSSVRIYQNIPTGYKKTYYESGTIDIIFPLRGHKIHGKVVQYYEGGTLKFEGDYYLNKKDGIHYEYYESGIIASTEMFLRGKREGTTTIYYPAGSIKNEIIYRDGLRHGENNEYALNGNMNAKRNYKKGKLHGLYRIWVNETLIVLGNYYYGNRENEWFEYYMTSRLKQKTTYFEGNKHGNQLSFYENGKLETANRYINDKKHGNLKQYYHNGDLQSIEKWKHGKLEGFSSYYSLNDITKVVLYKQDMMMYNKIQSTKRKQIETFYTTYGKICIDVINDISTISFFCKNVLLEYEFVIDNKNHYKNLHYEYNTIENIRNNVNGKSMGYNSYNYPDYKYNIKTIVLNNSYKLIKTIDKIYLKCM